MKIVVLGAGAWGTALACQASARHEVLLWGRDHAQVTDMQRERLNRRYLPGLPLPPALRVEPALPVALRHAGPDGLLVIATPMGALRERLVNAPAGVPVVWLCKGFEADTGALGHEIAREARPDLRCGVLSGPSFAIEVARGQATALVAASADPMVVERAVQAFHGDGLRVYRSADPAGVEVGGAVKNVLAIATGILDGLAEAADGHPDARTPGLNARAALITRGLAEMTRLGLAMGGQPATFMGLSGLGDLVLTATGALSRNRQVGLGLAGGQSLQAVLAALGHVAEGVYSARTVLRRAQGLGVEMPITEAVVDVLDGRLAPALALERLMSREARAEW